MLGSAVRPVLLGIGLVAILTLNLGNPHRSAARASSTALTPSAWALTGNTVVYSRTAATGTLLQDGDVLVAGGTTDGGTTILDSAEIYHASTRSWQSTGSLATGRIDHTATLLPNGKVLVAGGVTCSCSGATVLATTEIFDPATGAFSPAAPMNAARFWHTATLLSDGRVLVAGGRNRNGAAYVFLDTAEIYDPASDAWSAVGLMTTPRGSHTATLLKDGRVLLVGGFRDDTTSLSTAELYDPPTAAFAATASTGRDRILHTATLLQNGKVLVAGGTSNTAPAYTRSAELYDPDTATWSSASLMVMYRESPSATFLPNGQVLVAGGYTTEPDTGGCCSRSAELYDPISNTWSVTASMNRPLIRFPLVTLLSGKALAVGWQYGDTYTCTDDTDCDGMPDSYEQAHPCLNTAAPDANADPDGDGLTNNQEMNLGTDPCKPDTDADSCSDGRELGASHTTGGDRDPLNAWDFFDVPVPALTPSNTTGVRNKAVSIADVISILVYIGTFDGGGPNANGVSYNSDLNANGVTDGREYDRTPSADPSKPWRSAAPSGAVSIADALIALNQVGDNCN